MKKMEDYQQGRWGGGEEEHASMQFFLCRNINLEEPKTEHKYSNEGREIV